MLTITTGGNSRACDGISRRSFLRVGTLGLAGLSLADLLALKSNAGGNSDMLRDKSVVFLYLAGGPSQIETFDPKRDAPVEIRSITGEVNTRMPGVAFGGTFPKLAALADRLAIVRSFVHGNGNHDGGRRLFGIGGQTALSAVYSRMFGATDARTGMMSTAFISPASAGFDNSGIRRQFNFYYTGVSNTGSQSALHAPFHPTAGDAARNRAGLLADMHLRVPPDRLDDRRSLLQQLNDLQRGLDEKTTGNLMSIRRQAFDVLQRGISTAFDLSREDPRIVQRYDTSRFRTPAGLIRQERNGKMSAQSQSVLGRQLLLARRLCEAGCRFVTVGMNDWDHHGNYNSYPIPEGMQLMGGTLDHAVSAFLTDIEHRGLSDKILLVMTGEMGRTPRIVTDRATNRPGRNHWANLGSLVLAGGGLPMGQVIGRSDRQAGRPATEPIRPANLISTITHTLFDMGQVRVTDGLPNELVRAVSEAPVIRELIT